MSQKPTYEELEQQVKELEKEVAKSKHAKEALQSSYTILRTAIDLVPHAIYAYDRNGLHLLANRKAAELLGTTIEELTGAMFGDIFNNEEQSNHFIADTREVIDSGQPKFIAEEPITDSEGNLLFLQTTKIPFTCPDREEQVVLGVSVDITDRKQAEEALRKSEEKYRDLYMNAPNAYFSINAKDGSILRFNAAALKLLGYDGDTLMGMKVWDLYADKPHGISKAQKVFKRLKKGELIRDVELQMKHKDGTTVWINLSVEPIKDSNGNVIENRSMPIDITERKRSEEALRKAHEELEQRVKERTAELSKINYQLIQEIEERKQTEEALGKSEKRYRAVVESQTEFICRFFPDGTLTFVNEAYCRYFDKSREELIGHKFMPLIPESDRDKVFENIASLNPNTPVITLEHRVFAPNGEICWQKWTNRAIFDDKSNLVEYQSVGWDITDRIRIEESLQKAHHELERRVEDRTRKLSTTLKIMKRKEKEIIQHKSSLEKVNREIMETNQALSVLARNIDRDKEFLEKKIYETTSVNIMPIIKELLKDTNCQKRRADLEVLTAYLNSFISGSTDHHDIIISLTDQEMRVAVMIKNDLTSQKIANMLYISLHTVKTHRKNIRKKLNIQNSTVNLASYFKSKMVSDSM